MSTTLVYVNLWMTWRPWSSKYAYVPEVQSLIIHRGVHLRRRGLKIPNFSGPNEQEVQQRTGPHRSEKERKKKDRDDFRRILSGLLLEELRMYLDYLV